MPLPVLLLILATLLPLLSFGVLLVVGKRMGSPLAGYLGTVAVAGSFVCTLLATVLWLSPRSYFDPVLNEKVQVGAGVNPVNVPIRWLPTGVAAQAGVAAHQAGFLDVGLYVDSLTVALFAMITTVATLAHIYSIGYMEGDPRFPRFFTLTALFTFATLALVLAGTLTQLLVFWELLGVCSYLLVGFWYEKTTATRAALKAFAINAVGDAALLIGFALLFAHVGNLSLPTLWGLLGAAGGGHPVSLPDGHAIGLNALSAAGVALFVAAVAKSAQFPLHGWLADAAASPMPATALIFSGTTVAAGVYLVGRLYPIFTPDVRLLVAIIGLVTLAVGALMATVQNDVKRLLAYAAVSQLGFMTLAMGVGSPVGALFHLITHGFFAALLMLGAGSVIYAAQGERNLREFGGLVRRMPVTAIAFAVGVLAIAGTPLLSGYASKQNVLRDAAAFCTLATGAAHKSKLYWAFFVVPVVAAYLMAFAVARCWMLLFWGRPRNLRVYARARENPILYVPLLFLAVLAVLGGKYLGVKELIANAGKEGAQYVHSAFPQGHDAVAAWPADLPTDLEDVAPPPPSVGLDAHTRGEALVAPGRSVAFYAFAGGISFAFILYQRGYRVTRRFVSLPIVRWVHRWLTSKMGFDELTDAAVPKVFAVLCGLAGLVDRVAIDAPVNALARLLRATVRLPKAKHR